MVVIDQETSSISISKGVAREGSDLDEYNDVNDTNDTLDVYHNYLTSSSGAGDSNGLEDNDVVGDDDDVIRLDCDYEVEAGSPPSYLVVKWFKNDKGIYQWIRGQQPSVFVSAPFYYRTHIHMHRVLAV